MAFHEELFPLDVSMRAVTEPVFETVVHETDSPHEERVGRHQQERRRFNVGFGVRTLEQAATVYAFFKLRRGTEIGFRFRDYLDWSTGLYGTKDPTPDDVLIGTGDGSDTTFQLVKKYSDDTVTRTRTITKPVAGSVRIAFDGVEQTSGWTVDTTTGIVTFTTAPSLAVEVTAGFRFDVPARFDHDVGAGLRMVLVDQKIRTAVSIPIIELVNEEPVQGEFFFGGSGAGVEELTGDVSITLLGGRARAFNPDGSGHKILLPDASSLPGGGPYFAIFNTHATNTILLRESDDTAVVTIPANTGVEVWLSVASDAARTWRVLS